MKSSQPALYDVFLEKNHPGWIESIMHTYNDHIVDVIVSQNTKKSLSLLELGPGKGYFFQALKRSGKQYSYSAVDRNVNILKSLGIKRAYRSELPKLPKLPQKYDVIYMAYVIEHMKNGLEFNELVRNCTKYLKAGGILVMLAPNAPQMGIEFFDTDYTHMFPTSKRNVHMGLVDNGYTDITIHEYNDFGIWLTANPAHWPYLFSLLSIIFFWFRYRLITRLFSFVYSEPEHSLHNVFFRFYLFIQCSNIMIIARKS